MVHITVAMRVLLHMSRYSVGHERFNMPQGLTQDGIGVAAGISRAHASVALKSLREKGYVERENAHVRGCPRMRAVFILTPEGVEKANGYRELLDREEIEVDSILIGWQEGTDVRSPEIIMAEERIGKAIEAINKLKSSKNMQYTNDAVSELSEAIKHIVRNMGVI